MQQSDFPLDTHYVETEDGYILTLFQLRVDYRGTNKTTENESEPGDKRPAVLLFHGLMCSGTEWFCVTPENSLPLVLSMAGYDVWMACQRGSRHTGPRAHVKLSITQRKYWDFSVDELGYFDTSAFIDYIIKSTGQESIFYVGHSLGTSVLFILLSERPEYNSKIKAVAALAPAISGKNCSIFLVKKIISPLCTLMSKSRFVYRRNMFSSTGDRSFNCLPRSNNVFGSLLRFVGGKYMLQVLNPHQLETEQSLQLMQSIPGVISLKQMFHIMQSCYHDKFQKFDYGRAENRKRYDGQLKPPLFDISKITAPVMIFTSDHDYLLPPKDVKEAIKPMKNVIFYKSITEPKFCHADFMFGKNANELVYKDIIKVFSEFR